VTTSRSRERTQLRLVLVHAGTLQMVTGIARPTISYRALEQGVSPAVLGLVAACYTAVPAVLAISWGSRVDRLGQRFILWAGSAAMIVAVAVLLGFPDALVATFVGTVVLGVGQLFSMFAQQSLVAGLAGGSGFDVAFGRFTLFGSCGQLLGPLVLTVIAGTSTLPDTQKLLLASLAGELLMLVCALRVRNVEDPRAARSASRGGHVRGILGVSSVRAAMIAGLANLTTLDILMVYLPLLGTSRGLNGQTVGALLAVRAAASMLSRSLVPRLTARFTRPSILTVAMFGSAVSMALLASGAPVLVLALLLVVAGLGLGLGQPLTLAWVVSLVPLELRATALSWRLAGNRLTQTFVPIVAGGVASGAGAGAVFVMVGAWLGGAAALTSRFRGARGQPAPAETLPTEHGVPTTIDHLDAEDLDA
jgi:MFS family permease